MIEPLGDILSRLFTERGWGRRSERAQLEQAWIDAAGPEIAQHAQPGALRKGTLEIVVDAPPLLHELAQFHKRRLVQELNRLLPAARIVDLKLRAGVLDRPTQGRATT